MKKKKKREMKMRQERKMKETQKRKVEKRREKQLENFKSKVFLQNKEGLEKLLAWDFNAFEIIRLGNSKH